MIDEFDKAFELKDCDAIKSYLKQVEEEAQKDKKIVKAVDHELIPLKDAVKSKLLDGKLPCKDAWDIAAEFKVRKMEISGLCEFMGIKIKPCQLGAF